METITNKYIEIKIVCSETEQYTITRTYDEIFKTTPYPRTIEDLKSGEGKFHCPKCGRGFWFSQPYTYATHLLDNCDESFTIGAFLKRLDKFHAERSETEGDVNTIPSEQG